MSLDFTMVAGDDLTVDVDIYEGSDAFNELSSAVEVAIVIHVCGADDIVKRLSENTLSVISSNRLRFDLSRAETLDLQGTYPFDGYLVTSAGKRHTFRDENDEIGVATFLKTND
jgi:hypothetical protein